MPEKISDPDLLFRPTQPDWTRIRQRMLLPAYHFPFNDGRYPDGVLYAGDDDELEILILPDPTSYSFGSFLRAAPETRATSGAGLEEFKRVYENEPRNQGRPFRLLRSRHTGLPKLLNGLWTPPGLISAVFANDDDRSAGQIVSDWFFQTLVTNLLFGINADEARQRLYANGVFRMHVAEAHAPLSAHARYQQWHLEWPILNGSVVVHLDANTTSAYVSSSYFPLRPDQEFKPEFGAEVALEIAQKLFTTVEIDPRTLEFHLLTYQAVFQVDANEYTPVLRDQQLYIVPFGNAYRLAYWLEAVGAGEGWRLWIDAATGQVLGVPTPLSVHAEVLLTAQAAGANPPTLTTIPQTIPDLETQIQHFASWDTDATAAVTKAQILNPAAPVTSLLSQARVEAANVLYHADKVFQHFQNPCACTDPRVTNPNPKLSVRTGKNSPNFEVMFLPTIYNNGGMITFQTDTGTGLPVGVGGGKLVSQPTYDPELVNHEVTHGLMWLANRDPFTKIHEMVPFARALLEGYATYYAHSLAVQGLGVVATDPQPWATAAYRDTDWSDRWHLARTSMKVGSDVLSAPNLYPLEQPGGILVYDVGMIWARALWSIRSLVGSDDLTDQLAMQAYQGVHGTVCDFEMAAEGLVLALRNSSASANADQAITHFATRQILAEQGTQSIRLFTPSNDPAGRTFVVVGDDQGVYAWPWPQPAALLDRTLALTWEGIANVVALAATSDALYAASEFNVYQGTFNPATTKVQWIELPPTPPSTWNSRILSLTVVEAANPANRQVFAGTASGVRRYTQATGWQVWNPAFTPRFDGIARQIAQAAPATSPSTPICYVAALLDLSSTLAGTIQWRDWVWPQNNNWITAVAALDNQVYIGTLAQGIWSRKVQITATDHGADPAPWTQVTFLASPPVIAILADKNILCLAIRPNAAGNQLLIGATDGAYLVQLHDADPTKATSVTPLATLPTDLIVTTLHLANPQILVGTAISNIWSL